MGNGICDLEVESTSARYQVYFVCTYMRLELETSHCLCIFANIDRNDINPTINRDIINIIIMDITQLYDYDNHF
jgi:hypothetical protein